MITLLITILLVWFLCWLLVTLFDVTGKTKQVIFAIGLVVSLLIILNFLGLYNASRLQ